jgi:DNA-binding MarR family transcriptional regulator
MPRLPNLPIWSDIRRAHRAEAYKYLYQNKDISYAVYSNNIKKLIDTEKKSLANKAKKAEERELIKQQKLQDRRREVEKFRREKEQAKIAERNRVKQEKVIFKDIDKKLSKKQLFRYDIAEIDKVIGFKKLITHLIHLDKKISIKIGDVYYVISDFTRDKLLQIINEVIVINELHEDSFGSFWVSYKALVGDIEIEMFNETHTNRNEASAFFKYTHNTIFDLRRYGVYKTGEEQNHQDTCLIVALCNGGLEPEKLELVKQYVKNRFIPQKDLNLICDRIQCQIILKKDDENNSKNVYGKQYERKFLIGVLDAHYFIVEDVPITTYCIKNYNDVVYEKDCNQIYKKHINGYYQRDEKRYSNSFDIIKALLDNKHLLKLMSVDERISASTQFYKNITQEIIHLEYDPNICSKLIEPKSKTENITYTNLVFDFETYTNDDKEHIPYLVRTYSDYNNNVFYGEDCGLQMLRSLRCNTRLIAHNANYDYRFLIKHLSEIKELSRGNRLISLTAKFFKYEIQIKDTYHIISMKLSDFPKTFDLPMVKEVMPYELYNDTQCKNRYMNINYVLDNYIDEKDKEQFLTNIDKWNLRNGDDYDIIEYSSKYCELDCIILWKGYNMFRKMMIDCVKIDTNVTLTIASLAHQYFVNEGCYEGVYQLNGSPQLFIQTCVIGGRTMIADNKKIKLEDKVNDFDAVSLYPSAMARLQGFLKGLPKVISKSYLNYSWLKQQDGYFVEIVVKSVACHRSFPLMSYKNDEGVRIFTNDMIGKTIRVDKTTLEDLIEFQGIKFELVRGYYFNEGFNNKIVSTIKYLFNERLEQKKKKNPSQMIYKLIMNSGYGKSIMKPVDTQSQFFDDAEKAQVYMSRHYNWITHYVKFGDKTKVSSVKVLSDHYNIAQVGVTILSMSKRIMNEVMCLAEDNDLQLYYQDTDSIHIKDKDIKTLGDAFKVKYDRELIGEAMGQFHSDFEIKGCNNIYAKRSIFLGKKSYIDELVGTNSKGEEVIDYHIRLKGVPNSSILHACRKLGYKTPFELYEAMYDGKAVEFDLTEEGEKCNFKMAKNYKVHTLSEFKRELKF